jgi:plastocyanin
MINTLKKWPLLIIVIILFVVGGGYLMYGYLKQSGFLTQAVKTTNVAIEKSAFNPKVIWVSPGTTVTWTNYDVTDHSVIFKDFQSGALKPNDIFTHLFEKKGSYYYHCGVNPKMKGRVIVK